MSLTIDPPARLPVDYLSLTSLKFFMQCPDPAGAADISSMSASPTAAS